MMNRSNHVFTKTKTLCNAVYFSVLTTGRSTRCISKVLRVLQQNEKLQVKPTTCALVHKVDLVTAFPSQTVEHCKSLLRQCLDGAFASDKTVHHNSLVPSSTIKELCIAYSQLDTISKQQFLLYLCQEYGVPHSELAGICELFLKNVKNERDGATLLQVEDRLRVYLQPAYSHLFKLIGRLENGVKILTDMRHDAMTLAQMEKDGNTANTLRQFSDQLKATLSFWFSVGLLQLTRVTWQTPADILEKVGKNEAVHEVRSWLDLKHRLGVNRRCYMFIHNSMPREPLVYVHVALMDHISDNITGIVDYADKARKNIQINAEKNPSAAIFYSITSTQKGLQGIDFGVHMIRGVVEELVQDFPSLHQFSSLSPIPQFHPWLNKQLADEENEVFLSSEVAALSDAFGFPESSLSHEIMKLLRDNKWIKDPHTRDILQGPLMRLCAMYLCTVKRRGYAYDPVANFHLRNGSTLWRLNWLADTSAKGCKQSFGIMANYRYYLDNMEENSRAYVLNKNLSVCNQVKELMDASANSKL